MLHDDVRLLPREFPAVTLPFPSALATASQLAWVVIGTVQVPDSASDAPTPCVPEGHAARSHSPAPLLEERPRSHAVHVAAAFVVLPSGPYVPIAHAVPSHTTASLLVEKRPASHGVQRPQMHCFVSEQATAVLRGFQNCEPTIE